MYDEQRQKYDKNNGVQTAQFTVYSVNKNFKITLMVVKLQIVLLIHRSTGIFF
jgi:hypothetical protein